MKNKNNGFTLFETLISTIVFGILMILIFQISSAFFRIFTTSSSKQSMNSKFVKAYNQMQRELMITNIQYIYSYKSDLIDLKSRWMVFPVPTDENAIIQTEGNSFDWKRIFIYYLSCTNPNCPECPTKKYSISDEEYLSEEKFKYCSDKQLIRLIYNYVDSNDRNYFSSALNEICNTISSYTLPYSSALFPEDASYEIKGYNKNNKIIKFVEKRIIATDIFDMDITTDNKKNNIKIMLSAVRKDEIKKEISYGTTDFTKEPFSSKFVDKIEFIVNTRNGYINQYGENNNE